MERPVISSWKTSINENGVKTATVSHERLIKVIKYIEHLESKVNNVVLDDVMVGNFRCPPSERCKNICEECATVNGLKHP